MYPTLSPAQTAYILRHSAARWILCSTPDQLAKVLELWPELPCLEAAVLMDGRPLTPEILTSIVPELADMDKIFATTPAEQATRLGIPNPYQTGGPTHVGYPPPGAAGMPQGIPGVPNMAPQGIPGVPGVPGVQGAPAVPGMPQYPARPNYSR